ncbi:MAG: hypothetical protein HY791_13105, partial [Deltaproteobacteria bacterium]|nr:hypothetical protein [Deltaproteobacteria bacterium]
GLVVVGGLYFAWSRTTTDPPAKLVASVDAGVAGLVMVTAEEREGYIGAFIRVSALRAEGDTYVGPDGQVKEVGGLLAVTGTISNDGEKGIQDLVLTILPADTSGKVVASYQHDVSGGRVLKPGAKKSFRFTIPSRTGVPAQIQHRVE